MKTYAVGTHYRHLTEAFLMCSHFFCARYRRTRCVCETRTCCKVNFSAQYQGQMFLYEWEALVIRNLHAKYEDSIWNCSKVMTNVNIFFKVDHRSRSRVKMLCMSEKPLSQGTYMPNIKALFQTVQKLWPMLKLSNQQTNRQGKNNMSPLLVPGTWNIYLIHSLVWNLWNAPSASFMNFVWNERLRKILFIIRLINCILWL